MPLSAIFLGSEKSVFVHRTADELRRRGLIVTIVDPYIEPSQQASFFWRVTRPFRQLFRLCVALRAIPRHDAAIIHSLGRGISIQAWMLRKKACRVVGIAYGSDILRRNRKNDKALTRGLKSLSEIAATNVNVAKEIESLVALREKVKILRFGLPVLDEIELSEKDTIGIEEFRKYLGLSRDKKIISLGYSATTGQMQSELIEFFAINQSIIDHFIFIVPVQYGNQDVVGDVVNLCHEHNSRVGRKLFFPIVDFYNEKDSSKLRVLTDLLINNSISDAFSGTVQEVIYCGNCVLASDRLPYSTMPGAEYAVKSYSALADVLPMLSAEKFDAWQERVRRERPTTRAAIRMVSSWDSVAAGWIDLIRGSRVKSNVVDE